MRRCCCVSPLKSHAPLRPDDGGSSLPSLARRLFGLAQPRSASHPSRNYPQCGISNQSGSKPTFAGGSALGPPRSAPMSATALLSKLQLIAKRPVAEGSGVGSFTQAYALQLASAPKSLAHRRLDHLLPEPDAPRGQSCRLAIRLRCAPACRSVQNA